jgi:transcriptional regulator with XRE-family HTH domain
MNETPGATQRKCPEPAETSTVDAYIGARIRGRRLMLRLSEDALAGRLFLPVAVIHAFEEGMVRIRASTLHDISNILKVPIRFFFDGHTASADNDF